MFFISVRLGNAVIKETFTGHDFEQTMLRMVDQEGHFKEISSDPSQVQVDQKGHQRIRQNEAIRPYCYVSEYP